MTVEKFFVDVALPPLIEQLTGLAVQLHQAPDLTRALEITVGAARSLLGSDRVIVYRFLAGGDGVVLAESVSEGWQPIQGQLIYDPCFKTKWHCLYQGGQTSAIENVHAETLSPCYAELLKRLQVHANLVVPILLDAAKPHPASHQAISDLPALWGLLIAHQCSSPRSWQPLELQVLQQIATQLGRVIQNQTLPAGLKPQIGQPTRSPNACSCSKPHALPISHLQNSATAQPEELSPPNDLSATWRVFDLLQTPVWIFDIETLQMCWANQASLPLWNATDREELLHRNFSKISEATRIRLDRYRQQFQMGKTVAELWTFYPNGSPVSVRCHCSGIEIDRGRVAMLVEGTCETEHLIDQETLRSIEALRHTTVMISLYTMSGVPLMQNPAALHCYGDSLFPQTEGESGFLRHFVDPAVGRQAMQAVEAGQVFSIETQVFTSAGIRWHGMDVHCTDDPVTGNLMLLVNEKDMTQEKAIQQEHQQAEAKLEAQQIFLRQILDTVPSSIFAKDREGRLLVVNRASTTMHGVTIESMLGKQETDFNPNFDSARLDAFLAVNQEVMTTRQPQRHIQEIITSTGDLRWYQTVVGPLIDANDQVQGIIGNSVDITELKQAETALQQMLGAFQESENRYRSVVNVLAEGIVLHQADGQITACNASAEQILGLTQDQLQGRTPLDPRWRTIHEDGSPFPGETHPAMVTLHTGQSQFGIIMGVYKPDETLTWISINSQPLFYPQQVLPYAIVVSFTNITLLKQTEMLLRDQAERERMIHSIAQTIRQSLNLEQVLTTTVAEVRYFLQTDRVVIYRFNSDWSGTIVAESVAAGWQPLLHQHIADTYFVANQNHAYRSESIQVTPNIYTAGFSQCYIDLLEELQVQAKLVVPIWQEKNLWGLLVAHHCRSPRNWQTLESELLVQLATQLTIAIHQAELYQQLQKAKDELEGIAILDGLTQIANRRCFDQQFQQEWERAKREQHPISLVLLDVDYFKLYNDTYGHQAGDDCLRQVAKAIGQAVKRPADLVARYGGEEFVVLLPNTTSGGAAKVAQAIQLAIQQLQIPHTQSDVSSHLTVSMGIATTIPSLEGSSTTLITSADQALYQAKKQGRNTYCLCYLRL